MTLFLVLHLTPESLLVWPLRLNILFLTSHKLQLLVRSPDTTTLQVQPLAGIPSNIMGATIALKFMPVTA